VVVVEVEAELVLIRAIALPRGSQVVLGIAFEG
jgi:hypothetical protein